MLAPGYLCSVTLHPSLSLHVLSLTSSSLLKKGYCIVEYSFLSSTGQPPYVSIVFSWSTSFTILYLYSTLLSCKCKLTRSVLFFSKTSFICKAFLAFLSRFYFWSFIMLSGWFSFWWSWSLVNTRPVIFWRSWSPFACTFARCLFSFQYCFEVFGTVGSSGQSMNVRSCLSTTGSTLYF